MHAPSQLMAGTALFSFLDVGSSTFFQLLQLHRSCQLPGICCSELTLAKTYLRMAIHAHRAENAGTLPVSLLRPMRDMRVGMEN